MFQLSLRYFAFISGLFALTWGGPTLWFSYGGTIILGSLIFGLLVLTSRFVYPDYFSTKFVRFAMICVVLPLVVVASLFPATWGLVRYYDGRQINLGAWHAYSGFYAPVAKLLVRGPKAMGAITRSCVEAGFPVGTEITSYEDGLSWSTIKKDGYEGDYTWDLVTVRASVVARKGVRYRDN